MCLTDETKPFDSAEVWLQDGCPHATFSYVRSIGYESLQRWRDVKRLVEHVAFSKRISFVKNCLEDDVCSVCDWCNADEILCTCEFDSNGFRLRPYGSDWVREL